MMADAENPQPGSLGQATWALRFTICALAMTRCACGNHKLSSPAKAGDPVTPVGMV
jgi:hypothetical protein